jgi:UDP-N-acetylglucosamine/UDP-N-acetylgalactosamine diphosphorylase
MPSSEVPELLRMQQEQLQRLKQPEPISALKPWSTFECAEEQKSLRPSIKTGCLVLAGGEGSRLKIKAPKGTIPVTLVKKKSLFQLLCEKTKAASARAGELLPLAIMTSPLNHRETVQFFEHHHLFGLDPKQIFFFQQKMLPFLDEEGHWILLPSGRFAEGPDGNGGALKAFYEAEIWKQWKALGVQSVQIVPIDNPLADPFDVTLIDYHIRTDAEMTVKCISRDDPEEKVGIIVSKRGKPRIVEYFELPRELRVAKSSDGSLLFPLANIGLFCFRMDVIQKLGSDPRFKLPWHLQKKRLHDFDVDVWKFETFIFDLLPYIEKVHFLLYSREEVFSPLKNSEGTSSLETVQTALLDADRRQYARLTGVTPPKDCIFDLDPVFYYPTRALLRAWQSRPLPSKDYIAPDF